MCVSLSMAWQCLQHGIDRPCRRYRSLVSTTPDIMVPSHRARLIEVGTLASVKGAANLDVTLNTVNHNLPRKLHHHIIPPQTLLYWKVCTGSDSSYIFLRQARQLFELSGFKLGIFYVILYVLRHVICSTEHACVWHNIYLAAVKVQGYWHSIYYIFSVQTSISSLGLSVYAGVQPSAVRSTGMSFEEYFV